MDGVGFGQRLFAILLREAPKAQKSAILNMVTKLRGSTRAESDAAARLNQMLSREG
jgi:hypothetical protein